MADVECVYPVGQIALREVGLRDGLQLTKSFPSTAAKSDWIRREHTAGVRHFEVGSFLPASRFPQFADVRELTDLVNGLGAHSLGLALNERGARDALEAGVTELNLTPLAFILVVMAMISVMGMFLESIAIILITTPILLPALIALDIDLIWYGVLLMINLELAMITPPVGMNLFVIKGITGSPLSTVIRGAAPFVLLMIGGLLTIMALPELATWLPRLAGYKF